MKDIIVNLILRLLSEIRRLFRIKRSRDFDNFEYLKVSDFRFGYTWAQDKPYHPNNLSQYFDPTCIIYHQGSQYSYPITIKAAHRPKSFKDDFGDSFIIPYATGVLESKRSFMFGFFEAELSFPLGNGQWPAFWLTGSHSWPPEIDIVEGYSKTDGYNGMRRFQSNIHYKCGGNNRNIGAKNHPLINDVNKVWHKFGLLWTDKVIEFYYDDYLVRRITDKNILDKMNQPMHIILNSAIQIDSSPSSLSILMIKNIKYRSL